MSRTIIYQLEERNGNVRELTVEFNVSAYRSGMLNYPSEEPEVEIVSVMDGDEKFDLSPAIECKIRDFIDESGEEDLSSGDY